MAAPAYREAAVIRLPEPHKHQEIFVDWHEQHQDAQVLVAPCGTKVGKTFGSSIWLLSQALANPGFYCLWIAPTLFKCRIAYRYIKAMLPELDVIKPRDGKLEIWFGNGSVIKFLHGKDAESTVEGEAVDAFVIDESGKINKQLWFSLFTTITQTEGLGIITGTPRGTGHWYYDVYRQARDGDPFFCHATVKTVDSPFVSQKAVEQARRLLPLHLFQQYYEAIFVTESSVYGDLASVWRPDLVVERKGFWLHPDEVERSKPVVIGVDLAKRKDWTSYVAVNGDGETVGYVRFRGKPYGQQARILAKNFCRYFSNEANEVRYDRTGVGDAVGEQIAEEMDKHAPHWAVNPVIFTNQVKQDMVARNSVAIETGWWHAPMIERLQHEFAVLEVGASRTGLHTYNAPDGDHDDVHWAASLAISGAYAGTAGEAADELIEQAMSGKLLTSKDDEEPKEPEDHEDLSDLFGDDEEMDIDEEMD